MPLFGFYFDPTYIFVIIGALICAIASFNVSATYKRYSEVTNRRGLTAEAVAAQMLREAGIHDVRIEHVAGNLTDHYSPKEKVLRLSDSVYGSTSVAAIGVAAHECGHAIQHHKKYVPLTLRSAAVPMANIGSFIYWPVIILGIIMGNPTMAMAGVILFSFVVVFQLITLPVEFNASNRAMAILRERDILAETELKHAGKVLGAAALTYVASLFNSILQLLRLIILARNDD